MLLRRLLGFPGDLCKITCQPRTTLISRVFSMSNDTVVTSTSHNNEEDEDFFGITENDSYSGGKIFMPNSNEDDLTKDAILTKHLSADACKNNEMEKYISTKFGNIRFDWHNTAAPAKVREPPSNKTKESHQNNSDVDYFSEMYFGDSLLGEENTNTNTTVNDTSTVKIGDISPEISTEDDLDCIDYQYFGNYKENIAQSPNFPNPNSVNVEEQADIYSSSNTNRINFTDDNNFIESQYFSNSAHDILQAKSDTNASTKSSKPNLTVNAVEKNNFTEDSPPSNSFYNFIENVAQGPNFPNPNSVNLEEQADIYPHDPLQLLDLKNSSSNRINFTDDYDFIESQYFSNSAHDILQAKSDTNASTKSSKPNLNVDAVEKKASTKDSPPSNSFDNDNLRFSKLESFQSAGRQTCKPKPQNAYEASQEIRREIKRKNEEGPLVDSKGFRILKDQVNDLTNLTTYEIANHLRSRILYNKNDLIVIDKPYGLPSHGGPGINVNVAKALPELAKKIRYSGELHLIHRLDKETTGVMLLAKTDKMAHTLKDMFQKRLVIKTYWALTKGIPNPSRGVIDIPIAEGSVDGKHRMVLRPEYNEDMKKSRVESHQAITHYQVLNSSFNCALVECKTETGIKHQVRVHLGFGLNTPILGDHKYSHLTKMAPQRLFPEILERLHIRQSKVRYLPMHLHATSLILPEVINGQNLIFKAPLPYHFRKNMKSLKFRKSEIQKK